MKLIFKKYTELIADQISLKAKEKFINESKKSWEDYNLNMVIFMNDAKKYNCSIDEIKSVFD